MANTRSAKSKKRAIDAPPADEEPSAKKAVVDAPSADEEPSVKKAAVDAPPKDEEPVVKKPKDSQMAPSQDFLFAPDSHCHLYVDQRVHVDSELLVWDAFLNQTNSGNNNNKFYIIQVVQDKGGKGFHCWTRWGRNGELGQSKVLGNGERELAIKEFKKKFKDKSGLAWEDRQSEPKSGKYFFIQRKYEDKKDKEDKAVQASPTKSRRGSEHSTAEVPLPECTLHPSVVSLMQLIFSKNLMDQALRYLEYDSSRISLRDLDDSTINRAFTALKNISELLNNHSVASTKYNTDYASALEHQSNVFYSFIPHSFGRNAAPIIRDETLLKKEVELLDSLTEMKIADQIMEEIEENRGDMHPLDRQFQGLGLNEMTPLKPSTKEYKSLADYLTGSRGKTHSYEYKINDIFRIERQGEQERFDESEYANPTNLKSDRRLLWHGSRATNFGGILSQGLRIAPPEAPANGYMFGKGVYLADMSSKSAGYTSFQQSDGHGLLLLCESELGSPMYTPPRADYQSPERAKEQGAWSTWGRGQMFPEKWVDAGKMVKGLKGIQMPDVTVPFGEKADDHAGLYYNEYICYDVAQIKLRYLFRVEISYKY